MLLGIIKQIRLNFKKMTDVTQCRIAVVGYVLLLGLSYSYMYLSENDAQKVMFSVFLSEWIVFGVGCDL